MFSDWIGDVLGVPVAAGLAVLTVRHFAIPCLDWYNEVAAALWPSSLAHLYTPHDDRVAGLMGLGALGGYVFMAMGVCTILDLVPRLSLRLKVQGHKNYFSAVEWLQAVGVSLVNMLLFSWFSSIPIFQLHKYGWLRGSTPITREEDELRLGVEVLNFIVHAIVIDAWFYWTHVLLHRPYLYRLIHKFHHRFKAPTAVACMYANPLEFCYGNSMGMQLGPALTNCHPYAASFWMAFGLISTSISHSGYRFLGAEGHDQHHEYFDYNFGVGGLMDYLCGTGFIGSSRHKALLAKKQMQAAARRQSGLGALKAA